MPYKSDAQRRFFHTDTARKEGISAKTVAEFDRASKGKRLPQRAPAQTRMARRSARGRR